jgi:hypothetical protein
MPSVSFSCELSVAKKLDLYRKKHKLGSRTKAISQLLAFALSLEGMGKNYSDGKGQAYDYG